MIDMNEQELDRLRKLIPEQVAKELCSVQPINNVTAEDLAIVCSCIRLSHFAE